MEKEILFPIRQPENTELFLLQLSQRVEELLATQPERLMAFCYRLDANEEAINAALKLKESSETVNAISTAIWNRMLRTWALRQQYQAEEGNL
jgi:hypothetical protein